MAMEPNEACGCVLCDLPFLLKLCGISCQHINGRISFKIWISCISLKKGKKKVPGFFSGCLYPICFAHLFCLGPGCICFNPESKSIGLTAD